MDIEKAKEINSSLNWEEVRKELDLWISSEEKKLRICLPDELNAVQKVIEALEKVKKLPKVVIDRG